jgi:FSR family fosmidomycin resistance protein-like MFS transporter
MSTTQATLKVPAAAQTVMSILMAASLCHFLNDVLQSLFPATYPVLKKELHLSFSQIGLVTFAFQVTASLLQPIIGYYTDKRPAPYSLPIGMTFTLVGLLLIARAESFEALLIAAAFVGTGSAVFHPEAARVARMASGGRHGFAQSVFQVGGNFGSAIGPLAAALIVAERGRGSIAWFSIVALLAIGILTVIGGWYKAHVAARKANPAPAAASQATLPRATVIRSLAVLITLIFSKYVYLASMTSYYTFYLIHKFGVSVQHSQLYLFVFLAAIAAGTVIGGPIGDKYGRKYVIWISILAMLPFTLALPHVGLLATVILTVPIGLTMASAFPAIVVYAQDLVPGRVGTISGLFFGFAFGIAGIGAAILGKLVDMTSLAYVYNVCSFLPAIGFIAALLPNIEPRGKKAEPTPVPDTPLEPETSA